MENINIMNGQLIAFFAILCTEEKVNRKKTLVSIFNKFIAKSFFNINCY